MKLEECAGATLDEIRANEPATCSYDFCPPRYDFCTAGVFISFASLKAGLFTSRASGGWPCCSWENALWNDSDNYSILKSRKRRKVAEKGERNADHPAGILVLIALVFSMNLIAIFFRARLQRRF